jgi:hypothetical protein
VLRGLDRSRADLGNLRSVSSRRAEERELSQPSYRAAGARSTQQGEERGCEEAAEEEPDGEAAHDPRKRSFICRTSRSRPAWPPMNTNPSWSAIGNSTSRAADTQTPPATRISHDAA